MTKHQRVLYSSLSKMISKTPFLVVFMIVFWINYPMFNSWFGIIDDHMFISFLRPGNEIKLWEIPKALLKSEITNLESNRIRPIYWFLQFIQTSIFGDSASARYVYRTFLQFLSSLFVYKICTVPFSLTITRPDLQYFGSRIVSLFITVTFVSLLSWGDITLRLGPSEADLVFGICTSLLATILIISENKTQSFVNAQRYNVLCIGVIIASGVKENGVVSCLLLLLVGIYYRQKNLQLTLSNKLLLTFCIVLVLRVILGLIVAFNSEEDLYKQTTSTATLIVSLEEYFKSIKFVSLTTLLVLMTLILISKPTREKKVHLTVVGFLFVLNLSEYIFYRGTFSPMRYQILSQMSYLVSFGIVAMHLAIFVFERFRIRSSIFCICIALICLLTLGVWSPARNIKTLHKLSQENSGKTIVWKEELSYLEDRLRKNPDYEIVFFQINTGYDYERIYSAVQFLRFRDIKNPVFLAATKTTEEIDDLQRELSKSLISISTRGSAGWDISPISKSRSEREKFCISFGASLETKRLVHYDQAFRRCENFVIIDS